MAWPSSRSQARTSGRLPRGGTVAKIWRRNFCKTAVDKYTLFVHFMFMLYSSDGATPADPASHEPSQARPASRDYEEGGREPDPTDFFIRIMKRLAVIGMERMEEVRERSQAARAARHPGSDRSGVSAHHPRHAPVRGAGAEIPQ